MTSVSRLGQPIETLTPQPPVILDMSEQRVDPEEVRHIASLARIDLEDGDAEQFAAEFADVLEYFEALDAVPEQERTPELTNVLRPDEVTQGLSQNEALANAPAHEDGYFKGPHVS